MHKIAPRPLCPLLLPACVATAAFAQDNAPSDADATTGAFEPQLEERVGARDRRYMPMQAVTRGITGSAVACCRPRADRTLECVTGWESSPRVGYGGSGLAIMERFRLTEQSYADYVAHAQGRSFVRVFDFRIEGRPAPPPVPPLSERQALCDAAMPVEP